MSPPITIDYTNHRGERRLRTVVPMEIWYGVTPWHPEKQWLLRVIDIADDGTRRQRDFAVRDVHAWGVATAGSASLTPDEVVSALKNIGYTVNCAACMEVFYTGSSSGSHDPWAHGGESPPGIREMEFVYRIADISREALPAPQASGDPPRPAEPGPTLDEVAQALRAHSASRPAHCNSEPCLMRLKNTASNVCHCRCPQCEAMRG